MFVWLHYFFLHFDTLSADLVIDFEHFIHKRSYLILYLFKTSFLLYVIFCQIWIQCILFLRQRSFLGFSLLFLQHYDYIERSSGIFILMFNFMEDFRYHLAYLAFFYEEQGEDLHCACYFVGQQLVPGIGFVELIDQFSYIWRITEFEKFLQFLEHVMV